jgi:hypothetical protein
MGFTNEKRQLKFLYEGQTYTYVFEFTSENMWYCVEFTTECCQDIFHLFARHISQSEFDNLLKSPFLMV